MADTDGAFPSDMADTEGAIMATRCTTAAIMAIRCTTAAIMAAEDGTGAEATMEGVGAGTSCDLSGRAGISFV